MSYDVDVIIIGAGVIGLAVASEVAYPNREVYILEKNESFGRETSSRNSGTIHTGILSPSGSLNAELCLEGNTLLHEICRRQQVDHRFIGKLLVACTDTEEADLETLFQRRTEGIAVQKLSRRELFQIEPEINGRVALLLPEAGVVEPYSLMRCYLALAEGRGACLVCRSKVIGLQKLTEGYCLDIHDPSGVSQISSRVVINCAGLNSDKIAAMAGIDILKAGYRLSYLKGEYYSICTTQARRISRHLVYPMLKPGGVVGIHSVLDTDGRVRLGPDFYPVFEAEYSIDDSRKETFLEGARKLFPFILPEDIDPESAGVMPRRYAPGQPFQEFVIRHEIDKGLPGFINVLGIESPGLTSSPAIARYVSRLVAEII